jgi:hypothetical protein
MGHNTVFPERSIRYIHLLFLQDPTPSTLSLSQLLSPRPTNHDRLRRLGRLTQKRQTRLNDRLPINHVPVMQPLILHLRHFFPLRFKILLPLGRQRPFFRKLEPLLRPVMSEIKRHVLETIFHIFRLFNQCFYRLAQEALVLRLRVELLAGQFYGFRAGVVAGPG